MNNRRETLSKLRSCIEGIDKDITMILQNLQWDRKHLLEGVSLVSCKYDPQHRVPPDKCSAHEEKCFLRSQRYSSDDKMLPELFDDMAPTVVRLRKEDITDILSQAAQADPSFKTGPGPRAPLTAERVQAAFTPDERRAIHDAVVAAASGAHSVDDLALPGNSDEAKSRPKSKLEVLAELRDMRRRRAKYRGAGGALGSYSHVLRDVIKTQMELFTGVTVKEEPVDHTTEAGNARKNFKHKQCYDDKRDDTRGNRDEHRTERYEQRNKYGDKKYDSHKERHRRENKNRHEKRYHNEIANGGGANYERHIKKEPDEFDKEENGHSSKSRHITNDDVQRREQRSYYRDASESRSDKNYKIDRYYDSTSSRSDRRYKEEYGAKYEDRRSQKRHQDRDRCDDIKHSKHQDSKRRDEYSYDKKRKKH